MLQNIISRRFKHRSLLHLTGPKKPIRLPDQPRLTAHVHALGLGHFGAEPPSARSQAPKPHSHHGLIDPFALWSRVHHGQVPKLLWSTPPFFLPSAPSLGARKRTRKPWSPNTRPRQFFGALLLVYSEQYKIFYCPWRCQSSVIMLAPEHLALGHCCLQMCPR